MYVVVRARVTSHVLVLCVAHFDQRARWTRLEVCQRPEWEPRGPEVHRVRGTSKVAVCDCSLQRAGE